MAVISCVGTNFDRTVSSFIIALLSGPLLYLNIVEALDDPVTTSSPHPMALVIYSDFDGRTPWVIVPHRRGPATIPVPTISSLPPILIYPAIPVFDMHHVTTCPYSAGAHHQDAKFDPPNRPVDAS